MAAWAKSGRTESIHQAELLLEEMEKSNKFAPDLLSYSGVISCMAKGKRASSVKKAQDILHRMTKRNIVRPDNGKE